MEEHPSVSLASLVEEICFDSSGFMLSDSGPMIFISFLDKYYFQFLLRILFAGRYVSKAHSEAISIFFADFQDVYHHLSLGKFSPSPQKEIVAILNLNGSPSSYIK